MNRQDKIEFINDIMEAAKQALIAKADKIPDHWTGGELRQLMEDYIAIQENAVSIKREPKRYKEYKEISKEIVYSL